MKKIIMVVLVVSLCISNVFADDSKSGAPGISAVQLLRQSLLKSVVMFVNENDVFVNGELSAIDENSKVVPVVENGRTLVPLRFIIEQFDGEVSWNGETEEIDIKIENDKFLLQIGNTNVLVNDKPIVIEAAPKLLNEKTFVPLRVIADNVGKSLYYRNETIIISNEKTIIESRSEEEQDEIVNALKAKTYFSDEEEITEEEIEESPISEITFNGKKPVSEFGVLKTDNLVKLFFDKSYNSNEFKDKINEDGIEIASINGNYFLDINNNLYWFYLSDQRHISEQNPYQLVHKYILRYKLEKKKIVDFSADKLNIITLSENGQIEVSRRRELEFSEDESAKQNKKSPYIRRDIYDLKDVKSVFACDDVCFVIKNDGSVWGWGKNANGQIGDGTLKERSNPVKIEGIENPKYITGRGNHKICLTEDGSLYAWGQNDTGELGSLPYSNLTPVKMDGISDVVDVATGAGCTLVVKKDGTVWGIGDNSDSQLADVKGKQVTEFTQISEFSDILFVELYMKGIDYRLLAISKKGEMYEWGTVRPSNANKPKIIEKGLYIENN